MRESRATSISNLSHKLAKSRWVLFSRIHYEIKPAQKDFSSEISQSEYEYFDILERRILPCDLFGNYQTIMNNSENVGLEQDLTQRRANCTIWAHLLFWWIVPFGWIISTYKMRFGIPAYVMLGAMCLAAVTGPTPDPDLSPGESFSQSFQHGQKYGLAGSIIGTAVTLQKIQESRKTLASQKSVGAQA